ncbi:hypothetical protein Pmani_005553 [Petrolisthes manimaculis]|uniref:Uncharacterized protein n=1 Tax=Petrolisthes manimaculis TaxID=1843537 RepID=A0AAE1QED8_9EUCA|nr:hypothetical protein Pmani_005553 [Petrolisthes manimaculis]
MVSVVCNVFTQTFWRAVGVDTHHHQQQQTQTGFTGRHFLSSQAQLATHPVQLSLHGQPDTTQLSHMSHTQSKPQNEPHPQLDPKQLLSAYLDSSTSMSHVYSERRYWSATPALSLQLPHNIKSEKNSYPLHSVTNLAHTQNNSDKTTHSKIIILKVTENNVNSSCEKFQTSTTTTPADHIDGDQCESSGDRDDTWVLLESLDSECSSRKPPPGDGSASGLSMFTSPVVTSVPRILASSSLPLHPQNNIYEAEISWFIVPTSVTSDTSTKTFSTSTLVSSPHSLEDESDVGKSCITSSWSPVCQNKHPSISGSMGTNVASCSRSHLPLQNKRNSGAPESTYSTAVSYSLLSSSAVFSENLGCEEECDWCCSDEGEIVDDSHSQMKHNEFDNNLIKLQNSDLRIHQIPFVSSKTKRRATENNEVNKCPQESTVPCTGVMRDREVTSIENIKDDNVVFPELAIEAADELFDDERGLVSSEVMRTEVIYENKVDCIEGSKEDEDMGTEMTQEDEFLDKDRDMVTCHEIVYHELIHEDKNACTIITNNHRNIHTEVKYEGDEVCGEIVHDDDKERDVMVTCDDAGSGGVLYPGWQCCDVDDGVVVVTSGSEAAGPDVVAACVKWVRPQCVFSQGSEGECDFPVYQGDTTETTCSSDMDHPQTQAGSCNTVKASQAQEQQGKNSINTTPITSQGIPSNRVQVKEDIRDFDIYSITQPGGEGQYPPLPALPNLSDSSDTEEEIESTCGEGKNRRKRRRPLWGQIRRNQTGKRLKELTQGDDVMYPVTYPAVTPTSTSTTTTPTTITTSLPSSSTCIPEEDEVEEDAATDEDDEGDDDDETSTVVPDDFGNETDSDIEVLAQSGEYFPSPPLPVTHTH